MILSVTKSSLINAGYPFEKTTSTVALNPDAIDEAISLILCFTNSLVLLSVVRSVPLSSTKSLITFDLTPPLIVPNVRTTWLSGETLRLTID